MAPIALFAMAGVLVAVTLVWAAAHRSIEREREHVHRSYEADMQRLTRAFAEHVRSTIDQADQTLKFVRRGYMLDRRGFSVEAYAQDAFSPLYNQIAIVDANGQLVTSIARPPLAGAKAVTTFESRPHFTFHQSEPADVLRIGEPVVGQRTGRVSLQITRRIDGPDGRSFAGVVLLSLSPDYFGTFYKTFGSGLDGNVLLVGYDGIVRADASMANIDDKPGDEKRALLGKDIRGTSLYENVIQQRVGTMRAAKGGERRPERLYAFRDIPEYRLFVMVETSSSAVERDLERYRRSAYIVASGMTLLIFFTGAAGIGLGIRQKRLLAQLRRREEELMVANEVQRHIVASVSHELRTPLTSILGYSRLLLKEAQSRKAAQYAEIILQGSRHLRTLVNHILDLAKIEAGRSNLSPSRFAMKAALREAVVLYEPMAKEKGIELRLEAEDDLGEIETDRSRLLQIVTNLVLNAITYTDAGSVTVEGKRRADDYTIAVRDTGIGIAEKDIEAVFEPFKRVDSETFRRKHGSGLGLALVKEITGLLGGTVSVKSSVGVGTRFEVNLPARLPQHLPPR